MPSTPAEAATVDAKEKPLALTETADAAPPGEDYVVPMLHVRIPEKVANIGFWGLLGGAVVLGAVNVPMAALTAGAVVVARRHAIAASRRSA